MIGAGGAVGRALVPRLVPRATEVRALVRDPAVARSLRTAGAKVAVGDVDDRDTLVAVLYDAHTVCHLVGGLFVEEGEHRERNLESTLAVVEAAAASNVRRLLFPSFPGADAGAANAFLRAKGEAEEAIRGSGIEHVIVRSTHLVGPSTAWPREIARLARRRPSVVPGTGRQRVAPAGLEDLVAVLVAADDRASPPAGTFGLQGPQTLTLDEVADRLAGPRRWRRHTDRPPGVAPTAAEVLSADCVADAPDALAAFGLEATPVLRGSPDAHPPGGQNG